jgi:5-methylcytosine-specific restriction protein A
VFSESLWSLWSLCFLWLKQAPDRAYDFGMSGGEQDTGVCRLCERMVPRGMITLHHLTPRQKGGKAEDRTPLCKPCHKQLHAVFSNAALAQRYGTVDSLRQAEPLQPFLRWIRKQKPDRKFRTMMSDAHPHARRRKHRY